MQALVLASGSHYRAALLTRLGVEFSTCSPDINETPFDNEAPDKLAQRLAAQKAAAARQLLCAGSGAAARSDAGSHCWIIASDQVVSTDEGLLGKPGTHEKACRQLTRMRGRTVSFYTSLHMLDTASHEVFTALDITRATFRRDLDEHAITRYVQRDNPLDCAGSFKVESLGIALFDSVSSDDPTALIGLPMISVCRGLRQFGLQIP